MSLRSLAQKLELQGRSHRRIVEWTSIATPTVPLSLANFFVAKRKVLEVLKSSQRKGF
jgi:hypothetical protein